MALTRTAQQLKDMVRNRADHLVGTFRADSVLYQYISDSCRALVETLVDKHDEMYWARVETINVSADSLATAYPTAMWKLIMLRLTIDQTRRKLTRADLDEIDAEAVSLGGWSSGRWPRFRIMNQALYWAPIPRAAHTVTVYYVPTSIFLSSVDNPINELTAVGDKFDGVFGWDRWVVLDAAIKLLNDEKKDAGALMAERDLRWQEILTAAEGRSIDEPARVRDRWDGGDDGGPSGRMPPGGWY